MEQGLAEAAIGQAQQAYQGLSDLRLELERLEREWEAWHGTALVNAERVLGEAQANRKCDALDLQAKDTGIDVEVDYWTDGGLSSLEKRAQEIVSRLKAERPSVSTAELRSLAEETIPDMHETLTQLIEEARVRVLGSQMRANIADLVVESLETKGYELTDHTYEGEDKRGGFVAKLKRRDKSEIIVMVSPDEAEPSRNELRIHSFDDGSFPGERVQRVKEIGQILAAAGLDVGSIREVASQADPAVRDIERVRKQTRAAERSRSKPAAR
jgi:peroxiredoxin family protein